MRALFGARSAPDNTAFVQAGECGEVSRGAGRRLLETSNREQTRQSRSDALRTVQGIVRRADHKGARHATPWMWTLAFGHHEDRTPTHGYEPRRDAAMAAFAKSWRRE